MVKEQREVAGCLGLEGAGESFQTPSDLCVMAAVSPNSASVDNGAGRGSRRLAAQSVPGKVKAKNIPKREGRGGPWGVWTLPSSAPARRAHCGAPC